MLSVQILVYQVFFTKFVQKFVFSMYFCDVILRNITGILIVPTQFHIRHIQISLYGLQCRLQPSGRKSVQI
jgi:hypothetical protein